jgi:hypothetical protein
MEKDNHTIILELFICILYVYKVSLYLWVQDATCKQLLIGITFLVIQLHYNHGVGETKCYSNENILLSTLCTCLENWKSKFEFGINFTSLKLKYVCMLNASMPI